MEIGSLESKLSFAGKGEEVDDADGFEFLTVTYEKGWDKPLHKKNITALAVNNSYDVIASGSEDNYIRTFSLLH